MSTRDRFSLLQSIIEAHMNGNTPGYITVAENAPEQWLVLETREGSKIMIMKQHIKEFIKTDVNMATDLFYHEKKNSDKTLDIMILRRPVLEYL